jgi:hypothetical protein
VRVLTGVRASAPGIPLYDTMPDGSLIAAFPEPESENPRSAFVVLNWASRLREAAGKK